MARTTTKTTKKSTRTRAASEWTWEDFRPEWANEGLERISAELEKWTDEIQTRSDEFRSDGQKRIEMNMKRVQKELRKVPAIKRAEEIRDELSERVEKNIDAGVDRVYEGLKLARLDEVKKLERKIAQLNKKLRTLEKAQAA